MEKSKCSVRPPPATLPASQLTMVQGLSASELTSLHFRKYTWPYRERRAILPLKLISQPEKYETCVHGSLLTGL